MDSARASRSSRRHDGQWVWCRHDMKIAECTPTDAHDLISSRSCRGTTGNTLIVVYENRAVAGGRIDVACAIIFPFVTIPKIICVQVAITIRGIRRGLVEHQIINSR